MTTPHDAPRWVYLGGKMVQAKPDAPDHDSSPLYVLARDHAALVERCRAMEGAVNWLDALLALVEDTSCDPDDEDRFEDTLMGARLALVASRAALAGGRG